METGMLLACSRTLTVLRPPRVSSCGVDAKIAALLAAISLAKVAAAAAAAMGSVSWKATCLGSHSTVTARYLPIGYMQQA